MKRLLTAVLAALVLVSVTACSNGNKDTNSSSSSSRPQSAASQENSSQDAQDQESSVPELSYEEHLALMEEMYQGSGDMNDVIVTMETSEGTIKLRLFPDEAPKAVENFVGLAEKGYYEGVTFHRIIDGFMIQGGDPTGTGTGGESIWGEEFENEFSENLFYFRGCIAMANHGLNTNGSQFFIVQGDSYNPMLQAQPELRDKMLEGGWPEAALDLYEKYGGYWSLDTGAYTKFGYVIEGLDVVDKIASYDSGEVDEQGSPTGKPSKEIVIEKVTVEKTE